ncbi:MAG: hypothetical protein M3Z04_25295 [Chloroflexota bacterium]|nr:hypothetical protein [Chloroflexota bacterium]
MQDITAAIDRDCYTPLRRYQVPCSVRGAISTLRTRLDSLGIDSCYSHYFPTEWAASTAAHTPAYDEAYSACEWEFFRLVDAHLFPLNLDWVEELQGDGPETRTMELPIQLGGLEYWECGRGDLRPGWELLLILTGEWDGIDPDDREEYGECWVRDLAAQPVDMGRLHAAARAAGPPLAGLPDALAMIAHTTGSAWLDATHEQEMDLTWTLTDVAWMIEDYAIGRPIAERATALIDWLDDAAHWHSLGDLWAACCTSAPGSLSQPTV